MGLQTPAKLVYHIENVTPKALLEIAQARAKRYKEESENGSAGEQSPSIHWFAYLYEYMVGIKHNW